MLCQILWKKSRKILSFFFVDIPILYGRMMEKKERELKMFANMIVLNTVAELTEFLNNRTLDSLVNRVAFASDLLELVRSNDHVISINEEIGFCDDGGWIEIDDDGYVVEEMYLP